MLYFPLFEGQFPEWFPYWGGNPFLFFRPVFNIADMSITIGVTSIILFHRSFFSAQEKKETTDQPVVEVADSVEEASEVIKESPENMETKEDISTQQDIPKSEHPTP